MSIKLRDLASLGYEWEGISNAAADLWSWLPSEDSAQRALGDYWQELRPHPAEIMQEASMVHGVFLDFQEHVKAGKTGPMPLDRERALSWFSVYRTLEDNTRGLTEEGEIAHVEAYFEKRGIHVKVKEG